MQNAVSEESSTAPSVEKKQMNRLLKVYWAKFAFFQTSIKFWNSQVVGSRLSPLISCKFVFKLPHRA